MSLVGKVKTGYYDRYYQSGLSQGNLAGYSGDPYSLNGLFATEGIMLPRRDDILLQEGGGSARAIEAYMRLFNDSQVLSAWTKLISEVVQRSWQIMPSSQDEKDLEVAEFVRLCLDKMGVMTRQSYGNETLVNSNSAFDAFTRGMGESLILGMSVGEICWMRQGKMIVPSEIKIRDPRRFLFIMNEDGTVSPRLLTVNSPLEGLPIPTRSMIIHRHWEYTGFMDPYGSGLGRQLYSLVEFRRTLLSYWIQFADKHTTPTAIGTYELGTPEDEVNSLQAALQRLGQETAITIPSEIQISWLQAEGRPELYEQIVSYIDQQISYVINGESTVGQDTGNVGSYARDQISDSIRKKKAKSFSEEFDETLNSTLIRWITELNYPGRVPPTILRNFDDIRHKDDPIKIVQLITQLQSAGYKIGDLDWLKEKLDIPSLFEDPSVNEPKQEFGSAKEVSWNFMEKTSDQEYEEVEQHEPSATEKLYSKLMENLAGPLDDVGFERISIDSSGTEASITKLRIDEFTSIGEINNAILGLLSQLKDLNNLSSEDLVNHTECRNRYNYQLSLADIEDKFYKEDIDFFKATYDMSYRLIRKCLYNECVVVDVEEAGYWRWFAPYFIDKPQRQAQTYTSSKKSANTYDILDNW